jgi:hypothetical protein
LGGNFLSGDFRGEANFLAAFSASAIKGNSSRTAL